MHSYSLGRGSQSTAFGRGRTCNAQVEHGFSDTAATTRNNFNLLKGFLSRWRYATPLPLDIVRRHIAASLDGKQGREALLVLARRRFGLELLATGTP